MNGINIARVITKKRKEKGITQDDLASFIGVSKASVSKWETGQSYPDIVLLPQLSAYFNISIDDLMGCEPQMTDADIKKLQSELALEFASKPFDEVTERCRGLIKKYYSCFPLLASMGLLYVNYAYTLTSLDETQKNEVIQEAKELFIRVKELSTDTQLQNLALHLEATCELILGNAAEVVGLLECGENIHAVTTNETLLSKAYIMLGKEKEAKRKIQGHILDSLLSLLSAISQYSTICLDDAEHYDETCKRMLEICDTFKLKELMPVLLMPFYHSAAHGYLQLNNTEKALDMLELYTELAENDPLNAKDAGFFRHIENLSAQLTTFPRDTASISKDIVETITISPQFEALTENPRFKNICSRLNALL